MSYLPVTDETLIKLDVKLELESFNKLFSSNVDDLVVENIDDEIVVVGNDPDLVKGIITCAITGKTLKSCFIFSCFWSIVFDLIFSLISTISQILFRLGFFYPISNYLSLCHEIYTLHIILHS